jgi:hypothetical protein
MIVHVEAEVHVQVCYGQVLVNLFKDIQKYSICYRSTRTPLQVVQYESIC